MRRRNGFPKPKSPSSDTKQSGMDRRAGTEWQFWRAALRRPKYAAGSQVIPTTRTVAI